VGVAVLTDSTSYLPRDVREQLRIGVVRLSSTLDGVTYSDDAEDFEPFYRALRSAQRFPTMSQPSIQDLVDAIEAPVAAGDGVVGVFISAEMSGTYSAALLARDVVLERHPGAEVAVLDARSNSMELGYAAMAAARDALAGGTVEGAVAAARAMMERTRLLFVPDTLEFLRRGGRIGGTVALVGSALSVYPLLTVVDGGMNVFARARSKAGALDEVVVAFAADLDACGGLDEAVVHHIQAEAEASELAARLADVAGRDVRLAPVGPAIGAHVGPGAIGVAYSTLEPMRKDRR